MSDSDSIANLLYMSDTNVYTLQITFSDIINTINITY